MTEAAGGYTLHCVATSESTLISGAQWLCHEYAAELFEVSGLDLRTATFQTFTAEVNALPGKYAPENGGLLVVATAGDSPARRGRDEAPLCSAERAEGRARSQALPHHYGRGGAGRAHHHQA